MKTCNFIVAFNSVVKVLVLTLWDLFYRAWYTSLYFQTLCEQQFANRSITLLIVNVCAKKKIEIADASLLHRLRFRVRIRKVLAFTRWESTRKQTYTEGRNVSFDRDLIKNKKKPGKKHQTCEKMKWIR